MNLNIQRQHLSLLPVLEALLTEVHVTRAAARLNLSQSAVSHALNQLRSIYQDPLLIRRQNGQMQLSDLGQSLLAPIRDVLFSADQLASQDAVFDPKISDAHFILGVNDYMADVLIPSFLEHVRVEAPKMRFTTKLIDDSTCQSALSNQDIHVALGVYEHLSDAVHQQRLFDDRGMCVVNKNNTLLKEEGLSKHAFLKASHVQVSYKANPQKNMLARWLSVNKHKVHVPVVTAHARNSVRLSESTDLIATLFERLARVYVDESKAQIIEPPFSFPKVSMYQYWHDSNDQLVSHRWLRDMVRRSIAM
jgi:DNA-binding transcriptional LysR family regulator